ncbi:MAG: PAC2 family protein [Candidatus Bathyarchaeota archaeon]|nr:MAG: PAC2 family protein [Candidatus Bathyarchaeota archaeon]
MVCIVSSQEKPQLDDPVLIEGLPGIGFVANIAALHLIRELRAPLFAEIHCSSFQDFAVTTERGSPRHPINELYYYKGHEKERDLIIFYGNTQALTTTGQYELCGRVLDISKELGCSHVITLGGFKRERAVEKPKLYFAATDKETVDDLLERGAQIINGRIFGAAGLLVGLGKLRGFRGFCLLAETLGVYPDEVATREILSVVCKILNLTVNLDNLGSTVEITRDLLENFGLIERSLKEKRKEESQFRWFV